MEKRFGDNFPVLHAVYSWILRHSGWLLNRFCVGRDGYTAFQRYKGRIYNGEVCDLFECVLFKVPSPEEAKLDDRFRLGVWTGKTSRGDHHLIFESDEVPKCRTVKRRLSIFVGTEAESMLLTLILGDRGLHKSVLLVIVRSGTLRGPAYGGTPNCKSCAVDGSSHSKECRERFEAVFRNDDEKKAMMEAADAAATSAALQDEAAASSMYPPTTTVVGADVELPKDEAIPATVTGGAASSSAGPVGMEQAQFDVEITEATPKRSEIEEMPESLKVRKINGLAVCSIDIVGAARADYDDPRSSDDELKRKAAEESDAVHSRAGQSWE